MWAPITLTHTLSHSLSLITQTQHLCTAPRGAGLGFDTTNNKQQQPICHLPSSLHWLSHHRRSRRSKEKRASATMASKLTAFWNHPAGPKTSEPLFFLVPISFLLYPLAACYKSDVLSVVTSIELGIECSFGK